MRRWRALIPDVVKRPLRCIVAAFVRTRVRWSARPVGAALMYHRIVPGGDGTSSDVLSTHALDLFEAQLRHLSSHYRVVPASELVQAAAARRRGERIPVAITFDDDLRSHVDLALPALATAGMAATFFLCGRSLDEPFRFWWERLEAAADDGMELAELAAAPGWPDSGSLPATLRDAAAVLQRLEPSRREAIDAWLLERAGPDPDAAGLRAEHVRRLVDAGHEVGFHTLHHPFLPVLDDAQLEEALTAGRARLKAVTGSELATFAYPHGGWDARTVAAARAAGLRYAFTVDREPATPAADPLCLGRMESFSRGGRFALQLANLCALR